MAIYFILSTYSTYIFIKTLQILIHFEECERMDVEMEEEAPAAAAAPAPAPSPAPAQASVSPAQVHWISFETARKPLNYMDVVKSCF